MAVLKFYDPDTKAWEPLSVLGGSSQGIMFVGVVPSVTNAIEGTIYAVDKKNGTFELWTKENNAMVLLNSGGSGTSEKELVFAETYLDFPVVGDNYHIYIATKDNLNLVYRWDSAKSKYVTIGDKGGTVEAGHEDESVASADSIPMSGENSIAKLFE